MFHVNGMLLGGFVFVNSLLNRLNLRLATHRRHHGCL